MASSDDVASPGTNSPTRGEGPRGTPGSRKSDRPSMRPGGPQSLIGVVLSGRYRIERVIGEGGMGAVYQAEHTHMRKRLAVKVLHPEMSRLPEVVARFEREAMAAAHIDHPNVATATDFGKLDDGSFFLVLEYVEGRSLREAIAKGRLSLEQSLHILRQIAAALGRAHTLGIVHRDLKPENVMLIERDGDPDFVKVLDFGIAKVPVGELGSSPVAPGQPVLTQLGMVYGTPEYMAPEQALGQPVDPRADLYALGVIAYEMMTGHRPFDHESKVALLGMHVTAPVPPMNNKADPDLNVPPEVEAIVKKLLAKEASQRYADAKELIDAVLSTAMQLTAQGRMNHLPALSIGGPMSGPMSSPMSGPRGSMPSASALAPAPLPRMPDPSRPGSMNDGITPPMPVSGQSSSPALLQSNVPVIDPFALRARRAVDVRLIAGAAVLGGVVLVGILSFVIASSVHRGAATEPSASASDSAGAASSISSEPTTPQRPLPPDVEAQIKSASADIDRGNFASAIEALKPIEEKNPDRADVHALLERAYTGAHAAKDAMREAQAWLESDPDKAYLDPRLEEDVRNTALFGGPAADEAFKMLEGQMKTIGVDILYDIAWGSSGKNYPVAAQRAQRALLKQDVHERASPAASVAIDLHAPGKTCDQIKAVVARAKDDGDGRSLEKLDAMTKTASCGGGGGFLGGGKHYDCWPCLRKDSTLKDAITAVQARAANK